MDRPVFDPSRLRCEAAELMKKKVKLKICFFLDSQIINLQLGSVVNPTEENL